MKVIFCVTLSLLVLTAVCGSRRQVGGYSPYDHNSNSNDPTYTAVQTAAGNYIRQNGHVGASCANSNLQPSNVESQVVAGTNYKLTYQIPSDCSANGATVTCTIVVFNPLPYTKLPPAVNDAQSSCQ